MKQAEPRLDFNSGSEPHRVAPVAICHIKFRGSIVIEIRVPQIANAGVRLSIGRWFKRAGDAVSVGEPLVEIDTDNVTHAIVAPVTGVLSRILVKDGGSVDAGAVVGSISQP